MLGQRCANSFGLARWPSLVVHAVVFLALRPCLRACYLCSHTIASRARSPIRFCVPGRLAYATASHHAILRLRQECRFQKRGLRGITLTAGEPHTFIGLSKTVCPHSRASLRPKLAQVETWGLYGDPQGLSCLQHRRGWFAPRLPFATFSGGMARGLQQSPSVTEAQSACSDSIRCLHVQAGFSYEDLQTLVRQWERAHPCSPLQLQVALVAAFECSRRLTDSSD